MAWQSLGTNLTKNSCRGSNKTGRTILVKAYIRRRQSLQISCLLLRFVSFQDSCGKFWSDGSQCVTLGITQRPLCWVCQPAENVQASGRHGGSLAPKWLSSITFVPHQSYRIDLQWEPQERGEHWGAGEINQSHVHYPCMCVAHCFGGICLCALACTCLCVYCCHFN